MQPEWRKGPPHEGSSVPTGSSRGSGDCGEKGGGAGGGGGSACATDAVHTPARTSTPIAPKHVWARLPQYASPLYGAQAWADGAWKDSVTKPAGFLGDGYAKLQVALTSPLTSGGRGMSEKAAKQATFEFLRFMVRSCKATRPRLHLCAKRRWRVLVLVGTDPKGDHQRRAHQAPFSKQHRRRSVARSSKHAQRLPLPVHLPSLRTPRPRPRCRKQHGKTTLRWRHKGHVPFGVWGGGNGISVVG